MPKQSNAGRISIFRGKKDGARKQGVITKVGEVKFQAARRALETLYKEVVGHAPPAVSDADTIEFLARGVQGTRLYLEKHVRS